MNSEIAMDGEMAMMDCRGYDQENDIIVGNGDDGDNIHPHNNKLRQ